jgi:hypothetical protein
MTSEEKKKLLTGLFEGANLKHAQINLILEEGATIIYSKNQTNANKPANNDHYAKDAIMDYVGRLKPMVRDCYIKSYDQLWLGILELKEVKMHVYDCGKQQDTKFNRNLVAQIIHQMAATIYVPTANTVKMAQYLEPSKGGDHPVRQKLGESPGNPIKKSVDEYLKKYIFG